MKHLKNYSGKIVRLYSGSKVRINGFASKKYQDEGFDYHGIDSNGELCFVTHESIYETSNNMDREPVY